MPKMAMEGMDVVDGGIRPVFFVFFGGWGLSSTQFFFIYNDIYDIYIEDVL